VNYKHNNHKCFKNRSATAVWAATSSFWLSLQLHQTYVTIIIRNIKNWPQLKPYNNNK
jgi:hypothetical protein